MRFEMKSQSLSSSLHTSTLQKSESLPWSRQTAAYLHLTQVRAPGCFVFVGVEIVPLSLALSWFAFRTAAMYVLFAVCV